MVTFQKVKRYPVGNVSLFETLPIVSEKRRKKKTGSNVLESKTLPFGNVALFKRY